MTVIWDEPYFSSQEEVRTASISDAYLIAV